MGNYAEAMPILRDVVESNERALGMEHPTVASSLHNLALLLWRMGRSEEAIPYQARAVKIRELRGETEKAAQYQGELDDLKSRHVFPYA